MTFRKILAATTSSLAVALAAAPALVMTTQTASAQEAPQADVAPMEEAQTSAAYSETEIDAFVAAFLEVSELRTQYTERLQAATDETEQQAIVEEGNSAIVEAIDETEGMDVELYSAILEDAGTDTALNDRVTERLQAAAEG